MRPIHRDHDSYDLNQKTAPPFDHRGRLLLRGGLALWLVLFAAATIKPLVQPEKHTVYPIFAQASRQWWRDENLYVGGRELGLDSYRYSPTFAVLLSPLAMLPNGIGGAIWNALSVVVLLAALRASLGRVLPGDWPEWKQGVFFALTAIGSARGIWGGQSNALILAMVLLGATAISEKKWLRAAALLAGPVFIKVWPLAVVLLFCLRWPKQLAWRFAAMCLVLCLIPFASRPPAAVIGQYENWYAALTGPLQTHKPEYRDGWTLWEQLVGPVSPEAFRWAGLAGAAGTAAICFMISRRHADQREFLVRTLSLWTAYQLLLGPATERMTYGIAAPFLAYLILSGPLGSARFFWGVAAWLAVTILGAGEVERLLLPVIPWSATFAPLGMILLLVRLAMEPSQAAASEEVRRFSADDPSVKMQPRTAA